MSEPTYEQVHVASLAWLAAYRRESMSRGNPPERVAPGWEDLSLRDKLAVKKCVEAALKASDPANVRRVMLEINYPS